MRAALRGIWATPVRGRQGIVTIVALSVVIPGLLGLLAFVPGVTFGVAALAYVLAVVLASAVGGMGTGLLATLTSFVAISLLFTGQRGSLRVDELEDLLALGVFVVISSVVGAIVATAVRERARAERREQEAQLLHHLSTRMLWGERVEETFVAFAEAIIGMFGLVRCEMAAEELTERIMIEATERLAPGPAITVAMVADGRPTGTVTVVPAAERGLTEGERHVIELFAGQAAMALQGLALTSAVRRARDEAETSRARSALFSSVTHDLRTPLASILGSATSLLDRDADLPDDDRRELLLTIRDETQRLNRLVGNILQLSRARAGALVPVTAPEPIEDVIDQVIARLRPGLDGLDVRIVVAEDLPDVAIDVVQIDQALTNLVENAAKVSPPGGTIEVSAALRGGDVVVSVADQGPGIPADERDAVFEPFVRGSTATGPGSGLGLGIARAIVEAHGGALWIGDGPQDDRPSDGTTVRFRLPAEPGPRDAALTPS